MENVLSVTPMCDPAHLFEFVMNATMGPFRVDALYVEEWESLMLITVKSVHSRKKIGMAVQKLLT